MATPANAPWAMSGGATAFTRHEAQKFARQLLNSATYRQSLEDRILAKNLPPAVETMLWHYAYGKPIEQVNVNVSQTEDLSALSVEQLLKKAEELRTKLEEATDLEAAIPAQYKVA